jgi:hypothetical protein
VFNPAPILREKQRQCPLPETTIRGRASREFQKDCLKYNDYFIKSGKIGAGHKIF